MVSKFFLILLLTVLKSRIIPVLLIDKGYIVKTTKFSYPKYVGDPINIVRIFKFCFCRRMLIRLLNKKTKEKNINNT